VLGGALNLTFSPHQSSEQCQELENGQEKVKEKVTSSEEKLWDFSCWGIFVIHIYC